MFYSMCLIGTNQNCCVFQLSSSFPALNGHTSIFSIPHTVFLDMLFILFKLNMFIFIYFHMVWKMMIKLLKPEYWKHSQRLLQSHFCPLLHFSKQFALCSLNLEQDRQENRWILTMLLLAWSDPFSLRSPYSFHLNTAIITMQQYSKCERISLNFT